MSILSMGIHVSTLQLVIVNKWSHLIILCKEELSNLNAKDFGYYSNKVKFFIFLLTHSRPQIGFQLFGGATGGCVDIVMQTSIGSFLFTSQTGMRGIRK